LPNLFKTKNLFSSVNRFSVYQVSFFMKGYWQYFDSTRNRLLLVFASKYRRLVITALFKAFPPFVGKCLARKRLLSTQIYWRFQQRQNRTKKVQLVSR